MLQLIIKDIKATLVSEACFREKELQRTQCKIRTTFYGGLHMSFYMENMILHPFFWEIQPRWRAETEILDSSSDGGGKETTGRWKKEESVEDGN